MRGILPPHVTECPRAYGQKNSMPGFNISIMGRYYWGDIEGKWWFGVAPSTTPSWFKRDGRPLGGGGFLEASVMEDGYDTLYECPYATDHESSGRDDWDIPENLEDPTTWNEDEAEVMETHGECVREKKRCCDNRANEIRYTFDMHELPYIEEQIAALERLLGWKGVMFARFEYCEYTDIDEEEKALWRPVKHPDLPAFNYSSRIFLWRHEFCESLAELMTPEQRTERSLNRPGQANTAMTGTPLNPVCCSCLRSPKEIYPPNTQAPGLLVRSMADMNFADKKATWFENEVHFFKYKGDKWYEGQRFTSTHPYFCQMCRHNWYRQRNGEWVFSENIADNFELYVSYLCFGMQLRWKLKQFLREDGEDQSVTIYSEC